MVNDDTAYSKLAYKYFLKTFYNKINKKRYNSQIWQHNTWHTNIMVIKNDIILMEKGRNNKRPLAIKDINKTAIAEIAKVSSAINLEGKHKWAISNSNIDAAKDLRLTDI